ncbi:MAG: hypothetical protein G01um101491_120 [Parcubacteria group bacterium Gr01-1014_91]|nr:MAG: hypothetical protein G01um101491_120 [Parcubacteria group bacterium Gr01-1014_91]
MTYEGDGGTGVPRRREIPHYHGDEVRVVFVSSAVVLIIAQSIGADLPLSTIGAVVSAAALVIAAGVTNPAQTWIHWLNALLALAGTILFGTTAVDHYRAGLSFFDPSFIYIEALALLSLAALYLTTRTIRGIIQRPNF